MLKYNYNKMVSEGFMNINWDAVGAVAQIVGSFVTFGVGILALMPYMKKCHFYFSFMQNVERKPTFVITNNSLKGQFLNRIILYSGRFTERPFCILEMLDVKDDMLVDKPDFFVEPNSYKKIYVDPTRIMHYITHCNVVLKKNKTVYFQLDFGEKLSHKKNSKIKTDVFISTVLQETKVYETFDVNKLFD